jgi:hypothetical protein
MIPATVTVDIKTLHPLKVLQKALQERFPQYDYTYKEPNADYKEAPDLYGVWLLIIDYELDEVLHEGAHNTDLHIEWRDPHGFRVSWVNREWDFSDEDPEVELDGDWDHFSTAAATLDHVTSFLAA